MSSPSLGRVLTATVTPFDSQGGLDLDAAAALATHLVDEGNDGLVVNGTTGESATTTDAEKIDLLRAVLSAVGDRATVIAGVGTNDTRHSVELARQARDAGAHALLVVTPYYNKPPQEGIRAHFEAVAAATELPNMLYDIPGRSGVPIETETLLRLADVPNIVAVKDAKGDFWEATRVLSQTSLQWYSGNDADTLLHLAIGAVGVVGVTTHVAAGAYQRMIEAWEVGDVAEARRIHQKLVPAVDAIMNIIQGAVSTKTALAELGVLGRATVRLPLVEATPEQKAAIADGLRAAELNVVNAR